MRHPVKLTFVFITHLNYRRHALEQLDQLRVAIVSNAALLSKVIVISGHELTEVHAGLGTDLQKLDNFLGQRLCRC